MSWFDTTGLANLAKTALKEAQKQIDKALDIKDDDPTVVVTTAVSEGEGLDKKITTEPSNTATMKQSQSTPALSKSSNEWGSFTGSFFENSTTTSGGEVGGRLHTKIVTTPPTFRKIDEIEPTPRPSAIIDSTQSSKSESLEILSNPTTPGSNLTSPGAFQTSESTILGSESVEVLGFETPTDSSSVIPSNINSPSSCEVISEDIHDDYSSCVSSSFSGGNGGGGAGGVSGSIDRMMNSSFVAWGGDEDDEDDSISFSTVTDSTAAITIVEPTALSSSATLNAGESTQTVITTAPIRSSLHLALGGSQINMSGISDDSNESDRTIGTAESVGDCIELTRSQMSNAAAFSDAHLDNKSSTESFDMTTQFSDSTQSFEDVPKPSGTGCMTVEQPVASPPLSSDSKSSDVVKFESNQTSGHNSGDEIETATSSDIEIISSPNGDSSSTNSIYRVSPKASTSSTASVMLAKTRGFEILGDPAGKKGHSRELSEISIRSDDSSQTENDKLMRRICELQEILEQREFKLVELGRQNAELHEQYTEIVEREKPASFELTNVTEEYTQRLSALEKKFQQSIRERDQLRKQLDATQIDLGNRIDRDHFEKVSKEKEYVISELREEGEKLSKQVLQHSNIIKKLRAKEKESDQTLKRQKEQIEELSDETERLKKTLSAKDEVERSQIEAVHKLSSERRKLEKENYQLASQLEDTTQKLNTVQKSFEAAKKELNDKKQAHTELTRKTEEITTLEKENKIFSGLKEQLVTEINELREKLRQADSGSSVREQQLRVENMDLLKRLEESEMRAEEHLQSVTLSTIPLVKQLESLQVTLNSRTATWDKRERELMNQLDVVQKKLSSQSDVEQSSKEQVQHLNSAIVSLEERLSSALLNSEQSISLLQQKELEFELIRRDLLRDLDQMKEDREKLTEKLEKSTKRIMELEEKLLPQKESSFNSMGMQTSLISNTSRRSSLDHSKDDTETLRGDVKRESIGSSPTQSLARLSLSESQDSNVDDFDYLPTNRTPGPESIFGSNIMGALGHAPVLESLQSALKQRDGEVHQLQWELSRVQTERSYYTTELANLTTQLDELKEKYEKNATISEQFVELQQQYDAILQMYGEKVEETQELRLDLQDVKEMYKAQINELLRQQKKSTGDNL